jgi:hypothetical protein
MCCETSAKEVCKNSYEPQCYVPIVVQTASDLYCESVRPAATSGTCWRRCGLKGKSCAAPVTAAPAPFYNTAPVYGTTAPVYGTTAPVYGTTAGLYGQAPLYPAANLYGNAGLLRQLTTAPLNQLSYGLNYASQNTGISRLPALAGYAGSRPAAVNYATTAPVYGTSTPFYGYATAAPATTAATVAAAPVSTCDPATSCSCDDACVLRGDCCFDYCAFCVSK